MDLGTPLLIKWLNHLTLRDRWVCIEMYTLVMIFSILNWSLGLVDLLKFFCFVWAWCGPSRHLLVMFPILQMCSQRFMWPFNGCSKFLFHFIKIDLIFFFVAKLVVELKLFNGQNIIFIHYNYGFTRINLVVYVISFSKNLNSFQPDKNKKNNEA